MKTTLIIPDINASIAATIIALKQKPSSTHTVLAELIRISEKGSIHDTDSLHKHFAKLNISHTNLRAIISRLAKINVLQKNNNTIILCPEIANKSSQLTIKQC